MLCDLVIKIIGFFKDLRCSGCVTEKELKYFSYEYKKITNFGKLYLLSKIHKKLKNVPGRPLVPNCATPTEKVSEFLDYHLKPVMQTGCPYIKASGDFLKKIKNLGSLPENSILVIADIVGLYPSILHEARLQALEEALENRHHKQISTDRLVKMAQFLLKDNFFRI